MSRLPRHTARVKPPLRGRAATKQYQGNFAPITSVRRPLRPSRSATLAPEPESLNPPCVEIPAPVLPPKDVVPPVNSPPDTSPAKGDLYTDRTGLVQNLSWRWLVALAISLGGLLLLNQLF